MKRTALALAGLILLAIPQPAAAKSKPGDACDPGLVANDFTWSSGHQTGGVLNGMFCNGSTFAGVINFQSGGKVGIGTTSPTSALSVQSTAVTPLSVATSYSAGAYGYNFAASFMDASLATGENYTLLLGQYPNTNNTGELTFLYAGAASASNALTLGLWGTPYTVVITGAGNVGIGTTSPAATLDVAGEIRTTGNTLACASGTMGAIRYNSSTKAFDYCGGATPSWTAFNSGATPAGADRQIQFNSGGGLYASSGLVFTSTGNVGIGTTSPRSLANPSAGAILDEQGYNSIFVLHNSNDVAKEVSIYNHTSGLYIDSSGAATATNNAIIFRTTNTASSNSVSEAMRIMGSGSVGIGTVSPAAKLDVVGEIRTTGNTLACSGTTTGAIRYNSSTKAFDYCGGATPAWTAFNSSATVTPAGSDKQLQLNNNGVLYASAGLTYNSTSGALTVTGSESVTTATGGGTAITGTANTGAGTGIAGQTSSTTVNASGLLGTASGGSGRIFGVQGTTASPAGYGGFFYNASSGIGLAGEADTGVAIGVQGYTSSTNATAVQGVASASTGASIGLSAIVGSASGYGVYSSAVQNYFSGKVGIGTTSPTQLLTIGGNNSGGSSPAQTIQINNSGFAPPSADLAYSSGDKLVLWNASGIKHAIGAAAYETWFQASGDPSDHMSWYMGPTPGTAPVERMRLDSSGNLGLGTSSPTEQLHLYSAALNGPNIKIETNAAAGGSIFGGGIKFISTGASNNIDLLEEPGYGNSVSFALDSSPYTRLVNIQQSGNVGIGTTSPGALLQIGSNNSAQDGKIIMEAGNGTAYRAWSIRVPYGNATTTSPNYGFAIRDETGGNDRFVIDFNTGNIGIQNSAPGALLDIGTAGTTLGTERLEGNTSGYVQLQPAAAAGSWTMTLPANAGTSGYFLKTNGAGITSWAAASAASLPLSGLTAASASNTINNAANAQTWNWNTLAGANALSLASTSTAAASNAQALLNIALSGANATSTQTTYGEKISNTHTGTTSTNVGALFYASGGTNNYAALFTSGLVGIGTSSPSSFLSIVPPTYPATSNAFDVTVNGSAALKVDSFGNTSFGAGEWSFAFDQYLSLETLTTAYNDFYITTDGAGGGGNNIILYPNAGRVGIGTATPQATLDVSGYMRLAKNSSQPAACSAANDGAIALSHVYTICICKGGSTSWVQSKDGTTACSW